MEAKKQQVTASLRDGPWTTTPVGFRSMIFGLDSGENDDGPVVFVAHFPPNYAVPPHSHDCDYVSIVLEGSVEVTRKTYLPGHIRMLKAGTGYGPLIYGPEGCTLVEVFSRRSGVPSRPLRGSDQPRFDEISRELSVEEGLQGEVT